MSDREDKMQKGDLLDQVHVRTPATITLKEIIGIVTLVASIVLGYASLTTRQALMEENQRAQTKVVEQLVIDYKQILDEDRIHEKEDVERLKELRETLTKQVDKIDERLRQLEIQSARNNSR